MRYHNNDKPLDNKEGHVAKQTTVLEIRQSSKKSNKTVERVQNQCHLRNHNKIKRNEISSSCFKNVKYQMNHQHRSKLEIENIKGKTKRR